MPAHPALRLFRSAAFAVVCVALAVLGHRAGGGTAPTPPVLTLGFAAVFPPAAALAGRERRIGAIGGVLLAAQLGLHLLFAHTAPAAGHPVAVHAGRAAACGGPLTGGPGIVMLIAHLWAALLTAWFLARGEAALWALVRLTGRFVARAVPLLAPAGPADATPRVPITVGTVRRYRPALLRYAVCRRGPPQLAAP